MSLIDNIVLATLRNKIGKRNLIKEIEKLERAHLSELRMLQTVQKRFRTKFMKKLPGSIPVSSKASSIRMYETHNPGFCYHSNGQHRTSELSPKSTPSQSFEVMREMLFTRGEVDIEKVVCLHLLAAHTSQMDTCISSQYDRATTSSCSGYSNSPPPYRRELVHLSPKRTLLDPERSPGMSRELPRYVLDLSPGTDIHLKEDEDASSEATLLQRDSQLDLGLDLNDLDTDENVSLFVNSQIERMVDSIMEALQISNPLKIQEMLELVRNPASLRTMLDKPEIQTFLDSLGGKELITGASSYHKRSARVVKRIPLIDESYKWKGKKKKRSLIPSTHDEEQEIQAINLEIPNSSLSLEKIVDEIRRNVVREAMRLSNVDVNSHNLLEIEKTDRWKKVKKRKIRPGVNDSSVALAGSITGSFASFATFRSLGSDYTLGSSDTLEKRSDIKLKPQSSVATTSLEVDEEEEIKVVDPPKFSMKRVTCTACLDRWRFREKKTGKAARRESENMDVGKLPHVVMNKFIRDTTIEKKVMDEIFDKMTDEILEQDKYAEDAKTRKGKKDFTSLLKYTSHGGHVVDEHDNVAKSILRRMSNPQRIMVGMRAAHIKSHQVNVEGMEPTVKSPLLEFVAPVLSKDSIIALTTPSQEHIRQMMLSAPSTTGACSFVSRGSQNISLAMKSSPTEQFSNSSRTQTTNIFSRLDDWARRTPRLTSINLAKLKQEIAQKETHNKVNNFLKTPNP